MRYILKDVAAVRELDLNPGDVLETFTGYDYGMQRDHERLSGGEQHINLSYDGDTPFYTLPLNAVEVYT